jgi:hypothetical protein
VRFFDLEEDFFPRLASTWAAGLRRGLADSAMRIEGGRGNDVFAGFDFDDRCWEDLGSSAEAGRRDWRGAFVDIGLEGAGSREEGGIGPAVAMARATARSRRTGNAAGDQTGSVRRVDREQCGMTWAESGQRTGSEYGVMEDSEAMVKTLMVKDYGWGARVGCWDVRMAAMDEVVVEEGGRLGSQQWYVPPTPSRLGVKFLKYSLTPTLPLFIGDSQQLNHPFLAAKPGLRSSANDNTPWPRCLSRGHPWSARQCFRRRPLTPDSPVFCLLDSCTPLRLHT